MASRSPLRDPFLRPGLLTIDHISRSCQIGNQLWSNLQHQHCCTVKHTLITSDFEVILNGCHCSALRNALLRMYRFHTTHEEPKSLKRFSWSFQPLLLLICTSLFLMAINYQRRLSVTFITDYHIVITLSQTDLTYNSRLQHLCTSRWALRSYLSELLHQK